MSRPEYLLVVTEDGYGKRIPMGDIPRQRNRGARGVKVSSAPLAAAFVLSPGLDGLVIATAKGKVERIAVSDVPIRRRKAVKNGKFSKGVSVIGLDPGDVVAGVVQTPSAAQADPTLTSTPSSAP